MPSRRAEEALQHTKDAVRILQLINDICTQHVKPIEPSGVGESQGDEDSTYHSDENYDGPWADWDDDNKDNESYSEESDDGPWTEENDDNEESEESEESDDLPESDDATTAFIRELFQSIKKKTTKPRVWKRLKYYTNEHKIQRMISMTRDISESLGIIDGDFANLNKVWQCVLRTATDNQVSDAEKVGLTGTLTPEEMRCVLCAFTGIKKECALYSNTIKSVCDTMNSDKMKETYPQDILGAVQYLTQIMSIILNTKGHLDGSGQHDNHALKRFSQLRDKNQLSSIIQNWPYSLMPLQSQISTYRALIHYMKACRDRYLLSPQWLSKLFKTQEQDVKVVSELKVDGVWRLVSFPKDWSGSKKKWKNHIVKIKDISGDNYTVANVKAPNAADRVVHLANLQRITAQTKMQKWTLEFLDRNELSLYLSHMGPRTEARSGRDWDITTCRVSNEDPVFLYVYGSVAISLYCKLFHALASYMEPTNTDDVQLNYVVQNPTSLVTELLSVQRDEVDTYVYKTPQDNWRQLGPTSKNLCEIHRITCDKSQKDAIQKAQMLYREAVSKNETEGPDDKLEEIKKQSKQHSMLHTQPFDIVATRLPDSSSGSLFVDNKNYMLLRIKCKTESIDFEVCVENVATCIKRHKDLIEQCEISDKLSQSMFDSFRYNTVKMETFLRDIEGLGFEQLFDGVTLNNLASTQAYMNALYNDSYTRWRQLKYRYLREFHTNNTQERNRYNKDRGVFFKYDNGLTEEKIRKYETYLVKLIHYYIDLRNANKQEELNKIGCTKNFFKETLEPLITKLKKCKDDKGYDLYYFDGYT